MISQPTEKEERNSSKINNKLTDDPDNGSIHSKVSGTSYSHNKHIRSSNPKHM